MRCLFIYHCNKVTQLKKSLLIIKGDSIAMLKIDMSINGDVWSIHLNEDSSKKGCNFLDNEIWANGTKEEMRETLKQVFSDIVIQDNQHLITGVVDRIIKCVGMRL